MGYVEAEQLLRDLQPGREPYLTTAGSLVEDLMARIAEAATWCGLRCSASVEPNLRPPELAPRPLESNRWRAVHDVATLRQMELRPLDPGQAPWSGRFLAYFPDADLADGAAQAESRGFFDLYNCPPVGTWIGYFEDGRDDRGYSAYLLCWVPESLLSRANAGIDVNPEQCIRWLDQADVKVERALAELPLAAVERV